MTWTAPEVARTDPPMVNGERESLDSWLAFHRATILRKCQGLTGEQLAARPIPPSGLSLLGIVRHLAENERWWFRRQFDQQDDLADIYCSEEHPDGEFDLTDATQAEADFDTYADECRRADEVTAGRSLDETFPLRSRGTPVDLRWVYIHMIEEYARHNGHADLLREQLDGATGE